MLRLFKIEINKLLQSKTFRVLLVIYSVVYGLGMLLFTKSKLFKLILKDLMEDALNISYNPFAFPDIWIINTYLAQSFTLLAAIIVVVMVVNEFNYRTARQHIIDGLYRWEIVIGKFITVNVVSLIITLLVFVFGTIAGLINEGEGVSTLSKMTGFAYFGAFFMRTLGLLSFAMFLAFWIRRTGISILIFIVLHLGWIATAIRAFVDKTIGDLLPIGAFNRLIRTISPDEELLRTYDQLKLTDIISVAPAGQFIVAAAYISLFVFLSYYVIRKNDLK